MCFYQPVLQSSVQVMEERGAEGTEVADEKYSVQ